MEQEFEVFVGSPEYVRKELTRLLQTGWLVKDSSGAPIMSVAVDPEGEVVVFVMVRADPDDDNS